MTDTSLPWRSLSRLPSLVEDTKVGARFFLGALSVLRRPITAAEAHAVQRERLSRRADNFLIQARDALYGNPISPYRWLLGQIGCEYGDLERLVRSEGLEGALATLFRQGVYLTVGESRGRQPVTRGSATFELAPGALHNPRTATHLVNRSSGSTAASASVPVSFASVRDQALTEYLYAAAGGAQNWVYGYWSVPGGTLLTALVLYHLGGTPFNRWFSLARPTGFHPRYAWSERALLGASRLAGANLPSPTYVPLSDPLPIVRWMADVLRSGRVPALGSHISAVVRLCEVALAAGIDLHGAVFRLSGEPVTAGRAAFVRQVGARILVRYAATETGVLGRSCLMPTELDDLHFATERLAVIQPGQEGGDSGLPAEALLLTSLLPSARLILVNVSLGDQAAVSHRACGCPMERLGATTHLHTIRSFEKLTAGGMTFFDADVVRVLDEVLPVRFGGSPTDYQLVDEETTNGLPSVRLRVHPRLGPLNESVVREAFLEAMGPGDGAARIMAQVWRDAGLPVIERTQSMATESGKIQHVYHHRPATRLAEEVGSPQPVA